MSLLSNIDTLTVDRVPHWTDVTTEATISMFVQVIDILFDILSPNLLNILDKYV